MTSTPSLRRLWSLYKKLLAEEGPCSFRAVSTGMLTRFRPNAVGGGAAHRAEQSK